MSQLYRKDLKESEVLTTKEERLMTVAVIPKMHGVLLLGILILIVSVLGWAVTGRVDETVALTGLYHPGVASQGEMLAFVPITQAKPLSDGMKVTVALSGYNAQQIGYMNATITGIEESVTSVEQIQAALKDDSLVNVFTRNGPVVAVVCKLQEDAASDNGFYWTNDAGEKIVLHDMTFASMTVVTNSIRPILMAFPQLSDLFGDET